MAEQFLNKEGVQTLWSAVKNKISTAQQTVENEFTNGTKVAKTANNANNLGGVAPAGYVKQVKVGNTTYTANNSLISLPSYATLDASGKVPSSQLPSYVDDIIEGYCSGGTFFYNKDWKNEISGETGKIYVDLISNKTYRWGGSSFVEISTSLAIGSKEGTAYDGAMGAKNASDISKNAMAISSLQTQVSADMTAIGNLSVGKADKDHTHTFASLTSKPTTISGYGITDAYTKNSVYTKSEANANFEPKFIYQGYYKDGAFVDREFDGTEYTMTGVAGTIYIDQSTEKLYLCQTSNRWDELCKPTAITASELNEILV